MVFYRFSSLNGTLKATSAGLFSVTVGKGASGTPKYVYKPLLNAASKPMALAAVASSSSHSHVHVPKGWEGYKEWKSWKDVPDTLIPTSSKRDPENPVYSNPKYIAFRKKQIYFSRPVDLPVYLLGGDKDKFWIYFMWTATGLCLLNAFYEQYKSIYKKYYPDSNLFIFF